MSLNATLQFPFNPPAGWVWARELPLGTKAVLMSAELMDILSELADGSATVTWEWGDPDEYGYYTPVFTKHEVSA